ncbi:MAG: phosphosulfolactate synthase [Saprospiraceae bacterium]
MIPPSKWVFQMQESLDAGVGCLIVGGRKVGHQGLYRSSGEMRTGLLEEIMLNIDIEKVIFEAPNSKSQCYLINTISPNVN